MAVLVQQPFLDQLVHALERQVRVDRPRAVAQKQREVVHIPRVGGLQDHADRRAPPGAKSGVAPAPTRPAATESPCGSRPRPGRTGSARSRRSCTPGRRPRTGAPARSPATRCGSTASTPAPHAAPCPWRFRCASGRYWTVSAAPGAAPRSSADSPPAGCRRCPRTPPCRSRSVREWRRWAGL